ncbi:MAG: ABC transporter permease subunit [Candidatus Promineifilaceae bacterium]|jgi:ABC-2 type transport system permease protein
MDKVKTIIDKEWAEVFKNRLVLSITAFLPLFMAVLPVFMLWLYERFPEDMNSFNTGGDQFLEIFSETCAGLSEMECLEVYTLSLFMFMFMILPVAIPVTIAAYSVVGEKTTHSLEPLLATPITTLQLLSGKAIAAMAPAILATWISYIIFLIGARLMVDDVVFAQLMDPMWLLAIFIVGPLLALLAVCFSLMVSARVSDPRVAEQLSALIIMPLILLVIGQSIGLILINTQIILIMGIVVAVLDVILVMITVQLFERETILTRWK